MLSRVAESVFWMGRYMERTNCLLRILRANYIAMQEEMKDSDWASILITYGYLKPKEVEAIRNDSKAVLQYVMFDRDNDASLINNITRSRENARAVQDHITKEMWEALNGFYHLIREDVIKTQVQTGDPISALDGLIKHGMFLYGTVDVTMARGEAYNFLNIGKFIERSIIITKVLNTRLKDFNYNLENANESALRYTLFSLSGYELYLKSAHPMVEASPVINQIIYNPDFVHSLVYSLSRIERYFKRLFNESIPESYEYLDFLIGKTLNHLKYNSCNTNNAQSVHELLDQILIGLLEISGAFNKHYFGYNN
ncbi:MAG: alpha-E domain-containing protein [Niabella sp.]